jgi:hypothetical protein
VGGVVIAPWEVQDLPEEWLLAAQEITGGKKQQAVHQAEAAHVQNVFATWRRNHPAYRNL